MPSVPFRALPLLCHVPGADKVPLRITAGGSTICLSATGAHLPRGDVRMPVMEQDYAFGASTPRQFCGYCGRVSAPALPQDLIMGQWRRGTALCPNTR